MPIPQAAELRHSVALYATLPLGATADVRERTPPVKAIMLVGHPKSGKSALVDAIGNESAAVEFDLSPPNVFGKAPGKVGWCAHEIPQGEVG